MNNTPEGFREKTSFEVKQEVEKQSFERQLYRKFYDMLMQLPEEHRISRLGNLIDDSLNWDNITKQNNWNLEQKVGFQVQHALDFYKDIPNVVWRIGTTFNGNTKKFEESKSFVKIDYSK